MLHLIKYQFIQNMRERTAMFWALAFPIILGTLFYISFGSGDMGEDMELIPTAVVEEESGGSAQAFLTFLENADGSVITMKSMSEEEALKELRADEVEGIYYAKEEPQLTVAKSEIAQSILKALLDTYNKNIGMIQVIAAKHPENLGAAMEELENWRETTQEVSVGGKTLNPNISYFFALIAYACLCGTFLGVQGSRNSQANLSELGARNCITPTHKMKMVISNFLVLLAIHFTNIMILTLFVRFVLGIELGGNAGAIILVNLMGSMIGVSIGILLGCISRFGFGMRMGFCVMLTLILGFLAGLMFGDMKNIIEKNCPILNRLNPAAVLSDSYYCMAVFNDTQRMFRNLAILGVMSILFVTTAFLVTRRERYDSI